MGGKGLGAGTKLFQDTMGFSLIKLATCRDLDYDAHLIWKAYRCGFLP